MINVLLVDDHELVRTGIKRLLEDVKGIRVYAEAESGEAAIEEVRRRRPDVILLDVTMPGMGGLETTRRLIQMDPTLKIINVTMHTDNPFPANLLKAGAKGYLTKGGGVEEMVHAIHEVHEGHCYISPEVAQQLALSLLPGGATPFDQLSTRELQVLMMLLEGQKSQIISEQLCLSPKTVSTYRYRVFEKLGVKTDADLTKLAVRYGLIDKS